MFPAWLFNRHLAFELAPAVVFFLVQRLAGLAEAVVALIVAAVCCTLLGYRLERRVPVFPLLTVLLVLALGTATLVFDSASFVMMKPTVAKTLFAVALLLGLRMRPVLLARALDGQVQLTDVGWRVLTARWVGFALGMALLNECVWRGLGLDAWAAFQAALTPVSLAGYVVITRLTARRHWRVAET